MQARSDIVEFQAGTIKKLKPLLFAIQVIAMSVLFVVPILCIPGWPWKGGEVRGLIANVVIGTLIGTSIGVPLSRCLHRPCTGKPGKSAVWIVVGWIIAIVMGALPGVPLAIWAWERVYPGIHWGDFGYVLPMFLTPFCSFVSAIVFTIVGLRPAEALLRQPPRHGRNE